MSSRRENGVMENFNYKGSLQELIQKKGWADPIYEAEQFGAHHLPGFKVSIRNLIIVVNVI